MFKRLLAAVIAVTAFYCQRDGELAATYLNVKGVAMLFPCDNRTRSWYVHDSTLAADYAKMGGGRMFVRVYGTSVDSGSIYGSRHTFVIRRIVESRLARSGECWIDTLATPLTETQGKPVNPEIATTLVSHVQRFYDWYVPLMLKGQGNDRWDVTLKQHSTAMDSGLVRALNEDRAASARNPNEVVGLDFDPFVASQDPCAGYRAGGTPTEVDHRFRVEVFGVCGGNKNHTPDVVAELEQRRGLWVFVNFRYPDGDDLVGTLQKLKADRQRPAR